MEPWVSRVPGQCTPSELHPHFYGIISRGYSCAHCDGMACLPMFKAPLSPPNCMFSVVLAVFLIIALNLELFCTPCPPKHFVAHTNVRDLCEQVFSEVPLGRGLLLYWINSLMVLFIYWTQGTHTELIIYLRGPRGESRADELNLYILAAVLILTVLFPVL